MEARLSGEGTAPHGERPVILIGKTNGVNMGTEIPLTRTDDARLFPSTMTIPANSQTGLSANSVAMIFQLTSLDPRLIVRKIGIVPLPILQKVQSMVKAHLQLP